MLHYATYAANTSQQPTTMLLLLLLLPAAAALTLTSLHQVLDISNGGVGPNLKEVGLTCSHQPHRKHR